MIPWGAVPLLTCRDLRFSWPRTNATLTIRDFQVGQGERVFLCGPSGSGKSTLLGLIGGVLQPQGGELVVLEQSLSVLTPARRDRFRADFLGFIFQQFNLLPFLDPVENVMLGCAFSPLRKVRAMASGGTVRDEALRLLVALGLDARILERRGTGQLSVGQQQRVAAARALIGGPDLVLADEPTSALDAATRDGFLRLLLAECARHGAGLIFVSHDMALASQFDRVVALETSPSRQMEA
ncbi:putative ABC transport system ATP-binding protein [Luteibacter rhizovicinus]|uniref:Putative ABC transport system ATP-binding protein n=1 Tax=Luteibacter rhizovicinus TaxID=242606 RepID=A0A4R3YQI3_9GAMM|nr:ABC transporter ATP-binding protein [Luteibacter rhizovicinus]TCV94680.1 putative ABC transport system ATP-binding protein [Luteibacter rhizovicinus]